MKVTGKIKFSGGPYAGGYVIEVDGGDMFPVGEEVELENFWFEINNGKRVCIEVTELDEEKADG